MSWILVSAGSYWWIFCFHWLGVLTGYSLLLSYTLSTEPQSWKIFGGKWRKFLLVRSYYGRSTWNFTKMNTIETMLHTLLECHVTVCNSLNWGDKQINTINSGVAFRLRTTVRSILTIFRPKVPQHDMKGVVYSIHWTLNIWQKEHRIYAGCNKAPSIL